MIITYYDKYSIEGLTGESRCNERGSEYTDEYVAVSIVVFLCIPGQMEPQSNHILEL